ncbi:MAG: hypothetical protein IKG69_04435 [Atopobiaceae bacterium]|nr:hypothetical protein [Atopobiaceae bacterium]
MTEEEREQIRDATDIVQLVGEDVELRQRGGRYWAGCPFHDEKTPSFMVDPTRGTYHCFGCQAHGDVFDYVMRARGVTFPEAADYLASRAGITVSRARHKGVARDRISKALEAATSCARRILADPGRDDSAGARTWLESRGIGGDAIARWNIGLAPGGGEISRALRRQGFAARELCAAGIRDAHGDAIHHVPCVPVTDPAGRVVGLAGQMPANPSRVVVTPSAGSLRTRNTGGDAMAGAAPFTRDVFFGLERSRESIRDEGRAIVTFGPLETISLHEAGIANCVSSLGGGIGARQAKALTASGAREISLLYPDDHAAGTRAALASVRASLAVDARVSWAPIGVGTPLGPLPTDACALQAFCVEADELVARLIDGVAQNYDLENPRHLLDAVRRTCSLLSPAVDGDRMRAHLLASQVAERFGVREPDDLMGPLVMGAPIGDGSWKHTAWPEGSERTGVAHGVERRVIRIDGGGKARQHVHEALRDAEATYGVTVRPRTTPCACPPTR